MTAALQNALRGFLASVAPAPAQPSATGVMRVSERWRRFLLRSEPMSED
jgi:hypothetical protein